MRFLASVLDAKDRRNSVCFSRRLGKKTDGSSIPSSQMGDLSMIIQIFSLEFLLEFHH